MQSPDSLSEDPAEGEKGFLPVLAEKRASASAFDARCRELRTMLAAYLRAMVPDHAAVDDCLQETFIILWQRYSTFEGDDLRRVAFTCAKHKGHAWLEKNKVGRLSIVDPDVLVQIAEAAAAAAEETGASLSKLRVAALRQCLDSLSVGERDLIEARYAGKGRESLIVVADKAGRKADAVYKQLERVRVALKKCVNARLKNQS